MRIQVNTDSSVNGTAALGKKTRELIRAELKHLEEELTRIEVHLSDENSTKRAADDKRCLLEARPRGRPPIAVEHNASTLNEATRGAAKKLKRVLSSLVAKRRG